MSEISVDLRGSVDEGRRREDPVKRGKGGLLLGSISKSINWSASS